MSVTLQNRLVWLIACAIAALTVVVYWHTGRTAGGGVTLLPLDDVYIHFQYARQLALGQPYAYNPGLPPTSGATSLLYPFVLAAGYRIGFRDLDLGVWALAVGGLAFAVSIALVYHAGRVRASFAISLLAALAFGLSGAFAWHAMSGMETMIAVCWSLLLLYAIAADRPGWMAASGALLALTRPEGAVGAGLAALALLLRPQRHSALILLPLLAIGVQPLLNLALTGSLSASGSQAKSLFAAGLPPGDLAARLAGSFLKMMRGWLLPSGEPAYLNPIIALLALAAIIFGGRGLRWRWLTPARVAGLWLIGGAALIATLDTAFWHFQRYQMPFTALLFPLASWGVGRLWPSGDTAPLSRVRSVGRTVLPLLIALAAALAALTWLPWLRAYALNVGYVRAQPYAMTLWLQAHTPPDAVIAVHDVGMMRYVGGRTTLDMVGLTTPGAAAYWRQGPGAVGQFLAARRPDFIASYGEGHGLGLGFLAQTALYGEPLAEFRVELDPQLNVALAASVQGIYRPSWAAVDVPPRQSWHLLYLDAPGMALADAIDTADLDSEGAHDYRWHNVRPVQGFPTEYNQFQTLDCAADCRPMDGGRRINGEESFTVASSPGRALFLVTRVHAGHTGALDIYANDQRIAARVIPFLPGSWLEIISYIPPEIVTSAQTRIRIVPRMPDGDYMPYHHWVYESRYPVVFALCTDEAQALYQDGAFSLNAARLVQSADRLEVIFNWMNGQPGEPQAVGDWVAFVHLYPLDDDARLVAQTDRRPGGGTMPPGNWPPGMFEDTFAVDLTGLAPGEYRVAVGFYDPITFDRLSPRLTAHAPAEYSAAGDGRLFIGTIRIP